MFSAQLIRVEFLPLPRPSSHLKRFVADSLVVSRPRTLCSFAAIPNADLEQILPQHILYVKDLNMHGGEEEKGSSVGLEVLADGKVCKEHAQSSLAEVQECWIAVKTGQNLRIKVDLNMASRQYQVDLNIDGVLRNIWVSDTTDTDEIRNNLIVFSEGVHRTGRSLRRGRLTVGGFKSGSTSSTCADTSSLLTSLAQTLLWRRTFQHKPLFLSVLWK